MDLDVKQLYQSLPREARENVENAMTDDGLEFSDIGLNYLKDQVKWTIECLTMEMGDMDEWFNPKEVKAKIAACNRFLDKHNTNN